MPLFWAHWPDEIVAHLAEHDVTPDEFEDVFHDSDREFQSQKFGNPARIGYDRRGRRLFITYRWIDGIELEPITAFEIGE